MSFRETLPLGCPPADSTEIVSETEIFRITRSAIVADEDFHSLQLLRPGRDFGDVACRACGVSVNTVREHALQLLKLPRFAGCSVCRVRLQAGAGRLQQTGRWPHHTWWPSSAFNILAACEGIAA